MNRIIIQIPDWEDNIFPHIVDGDPTLLTEPAARYHATIELAEYFCCHMCGSLEYDELHPNTVDVILTIESQLKEAYALYGVDIDTLIVHTIEFIDRQGGMVAYANRR